MSGRTPMAGEEERYPLLQIMLGNSFLLSTVYLAAGLGVELLRRYLPGERVIRLSNALDRLPAGVLEALGVLGPLREAYLHNEIGALGLRVVFAATAVALIFALALVVGGGMWLVLWAQRRRSAT